MEECFAWMNVKGFADELQEVIKNNQVKDEWDFCTNYSEETLNYLKGQLPKLYSMSETMRAIQKLYEGDYSEETFMKEVKKFENVTTNNETHQ